ncbi:MAG: hypothetical protein V2A34_07265 [Lentisphaerota bacterium]
MGCLLLGACEPLNKMERNYYRRQGSQAQPATYRKTAESLNDEGRAMTLVQSSPAPDGGGLMGDWVTRELEKEKGDVLFPQWKARRSGLTKYEVRFFYMLVNASKVIQHKGYAWDADVSLNEVSPPRALKIAELEAEGKKP